MEHEEQTREFYELARRLSAALTNEQIAYIIAYKEEMNPPGTKVPIEETASLSAHSARIRPEFSFLPLENLRVFINVTIAGSYWVGDDTSIFDDLKAYSGVDIYTGIAGGVRLYF